MSPAERSDREREHHEGNRWWRCIPIADAYLYVLSNPALPDAAELDRLRRRYEAGRPYATRPSVYGSPEPLPREALDRSKRLQSAHHRMLRVTAVTCAACKAERVSPDRPTPP